jgi:hypothetical protein
MLLPPFPHSIIAMREIQYFEGPLLTEFEDMSGAFFLRYWCDRSEAGDRWLLFKTRKDLIEQYESGAISLRRLMDNSCKGKNLYLLENGTMWLVAYNRLPADYRPTVRSFR